MKPRPSNPHAPKPNGRDMDSSFGNPSNQLGIAFTTFKSLSVSVLQPWEHETKPKPISRSDSAEASFPPTSDIYTDKAN